MNNITLNGSIINTGNFYVSGLIYLCQDTEVNISNVVIKSPEISSKTSGACGCVSID